MRGKNGPNATNHEHMQLKGFTIWAGAEFLPYVDSFDYRKATEKINTIREHNEYS